MIKVEKFKFTYECWWDLILEVDPTKTENFKEQLLFWSGGHDRIRSENGDLKMAFLKMLAEEIIQMSLTMNENGIIHEFENKEGWLPLTIENGVRIVEVDSFQFDGDDFFIEKLDD